MSAIPSWLRRSPNVEILFGLFAAANLLAIVVVPNAETLPFHLIWLGLTALYFFKVWGFRATAIVFVLISLLSGAALFVAVSENGPGLDELSEVPLMGTMFLAMAWHAYRAKELTGELVARNEREREFLRNMAHEVRTTITIARGHTELIRATCAHQPTPSETVTLADDADVVLDELTRLARMSNRLMLLASSHLPDFVQPTRVDVPALLDEAVRRWRAVAPREWLVETPAGTIPADKERLTAALDAILENAVRHTSEGDSISLVAMAVDGDVVIDVTDTGEGISEDDLRGVFGRRYSRSQAQRGTGLGLAIVTAIVEAHEGSVRISSTLGSGTTVRLRLPGFEAAPEQAVPAPRLPTPEPVGDVALAEKT